MKILLATHNKHKVVEMSAILNEIFAAKCFEANIEIVTPDAIEKENGIKIEMPEETGTTFEENAKIKALGLSRFGVISMADDSGIMIDALNGEPGVYSARYSGGSDEDNNDLVLKKLDGVPDEKRTARYACAVCAIFPNGDTLEATGYCEGRILRERRGNGGFGYDPLFYYPDFGMTLAEAEAERKNKVSHRRNALNAIAEKLVVYLEAHPEYR